MFIDSHEKLSVALDEGGTGLTSENKREGSWRAKW